MRRPNSLRFRILVAFVTAGAVLGPLLATSLLWVTYELEERAVSSSLGLYPSGFGHTLPHYGDRLSAAICTEIWACSER